MHMGKLAEKQHNQWLQTRWEITYFVEAVGPAAAVDDFLLVTGKGAIDGEASFFEETLRNRNGIY